ncbi:MAG: DUF4174 domain-containing protein [Caldithrix sp.]|nr:DUF4174 domain-containing protein [Caldithrix sp.]
MKPFFIIMSIVSPFIVVKGESMQTVKDFQWKNRIIIVGVTDNGNYYVKALWQKNDGITDRDIVWFVADSNSIQTNMDSVHQEMASSVRSYLKTEDNGLQVILIGKDGGIKKRSPELNIEALFQRIDAMPMRMQEMRKNGQ